MLYTTLNAISIQYEVEKTIYVVDRSYSVNIDKV